jgi:hypothetical protein
VTQQPYTYTILKDGRVKIVNTKGQVLTVSRTEIENAFTKPLSQDMRIKYQGALLALGKAETEPDEADRVSR